jgi:hypothetical protein
MEALSMSEKRYSKEDVEALLDIAVKARERLRPNCRHPEEWRTSGICGICLRSVDKREAGLYNKFHVERMDGQSVPGEKHDGCEYFVLDITHDPHAKAALLAYAESCKTDCPLLSHDLRATAIFATAPSGEVKPS